ncbi:MAG TPA: maleylacetoacetate isomerase [Burkholderiales bacterium]|jgi:maleylacetoacetate isomerase|nr:maleylacetoacetate isomerase [Burkholderiales bacterium]
MRLYGYFRSSASYRVRIALNLKGLTCEQISVHLAKGRQYEPQFAAISPQNLVPVLEHEGRLLYQSLAICEFLDETCPDPPLLPKEPFERARVRSLALLIAAEIHPLNNVRVLNYLTRTLQVSDAQRQAWYAHWVVTGFSALEKRLATEKATGRFCHGDQPGLADIALVPQVANANRFKVDLGAFPTIRRINDECLKLEAFRKAMPENQPDAE